jgi:hypothetical protein
MICAVYKHKDGAGNILYIGQSTNPEARNRRHKACAEWWSSVVETDVSWYSSKEEATVAEALAILEQRPPGNKSIPVRVLANKFFPTVSVKSWRGKSYEKPQKDKHRYQIKLTQAEYDEIKTAAKSEGFQVGPFMRFASLRLARQ